MLGKKKLNLHEILIICISRRFNVANLTDVNVDTMGLRENAMGLRGRPSRSRAVKAFRAAFVFALVPFRTPAEHVRLPVA